MAELRLPNGLVVLLDAADLEWASQFKWYVTKTRTRRENYYVFRHVYGDGKQRSAFIHREILAAPKDLHVDHVNGSGLDNRRENLRLCTRSQNLANTDIARDQYRGVYPRCRKWIAVISDGNQKTRYLGTFPTPDLAARAYDQAAFARYGEFARLNFQRKQGRE